MEMRAKKSNQFFEKLRYKISVEFMLKYYHGAAWEGNDRDVISDNFYCPNPFPRAMNHVSKYPGVWGRAPC
jgi:hypothetical protein